MAFDKVKTLQAAEKNLEMGKIPAAIKEYCKLVENDPEDFTTLNILGDLHVRVGNKPAAISCFRRIAEHYRDQDFALKAIAMFKKIDRLQPDDVEIASNLADLYAQQDLVVDARAHYLVVANAHAKSGATQARLEVLGKIADLDPQNSEIRIKLAEGYLREGMNREASEAFGTAGQNLLARGALDEALEAFMRSLECEPDNYETLAGLLAAHKARGTADDAAEIIAQASTQHPDDIDLISLLGQAYIEAENPELAEKITADLIAREPSAYLRSSEVARLYLSCNRLEDAVRVIDSMSEQMLAEREETQLLDLVNELLAIDSDNVQALRLLVRTYWWQRDMDNLKAALERLADAAQAAGLEQEERYALTQLTRLTSDQPHHLERLNELGGAEEGGEGMLPAIESEQETSAESSAPSDTEYAFQSNEYASDAETTFEWNSVAEEATHSEPAAEMQIERGFTFESVVAEELSPDGNLTSDAGAGGEDPHAVLRAQELESVDFYIAQGYVDIAVDTLDLLEKQFGDHEDIRKRRRQLTAGTSSSPIAADAEPSTQFQEEVPHRDQTRSTKATQPEPPKSATQVIDPGLAEVFEEYRVSAEAEANGNGDYETHYNLGLAYQEMDLFEEALEEFQIAIGLVSPADGTPRYLQCCNLLGHCFLQKGVPQLAVKWFNKGLEVPAASEEERQALRFDLAAAYEQAGDLSRAKDIFTEVYGMNVSYRGVNERLRALESRLG
jgi:tetratricopeptide (TPR) repeat protein